MLHAFVCVHIIGMFSLDLRTRPHFHSRLITSPPFLLVSAETLSTAPHCIQTLSTPAFSSETLLMAPMIVLTPASSPAQARPPREVLWTAEASLTLCRSFETWETPLRQAEVSLFCCVENSPRWRSGPSGSGQKGSCLRCGL